MHVNTHGLRIYLASRSPRRRELLQQIGVGFDTILCRDLPRGELAVDETPLADEAPLAYVQRVVRSKAENGYRIVQWRKLRRQPILAADTSLDLDGETIGKPRDADDAKRILTRLSGRTHRVLTAVAVSLDTRIEMVVSISEVRCRQLLSTEIARYVATGEPMDKAGAYGIQGYAGIFVEHLAGSYTGVMGLPVCETAQLLRRFDYPL